MLATSDGCDGWREHIAEKFAALSHPARLAILMHLSRQSCCCKDVVERLDLAQSTVSQHLQVLVRAGLVRFSSDRRRSFYEVDRGALEEVAAAASVLAARCSRTESVT